MSTKMESKEISILSSYKQVFSTIKGKEVLNDLLSKGHYFGTSYVKGDSHGTAFNEGTRSVVGYIISKMELTPNDIREIYKETKDYEGDYDD